MKKNLLTLATLLSIMKISTGQILIAIIFTTLSYASEVSGQDILQQKITVRIEEKGLTEALSELENAAKINFFYSPKNISAKRKISIVAKNRELRDVLKELFTPLSISYEIQGERILLKKNNPSIEKKEESLETQIELQEQNITGTVTDEKGEPLVGVSIAIKGTTKGSVTNEKGQFTINLPDSYNVLVFSYIGYKKQEIQVGKVSELNIKLVAEQQSLDEVVVVGYGTQKKINLTGSVSTISSKEIADRPITQSSQALAGLMTGVSVSQGSGQPGNNGASITIRGIGSYGAGGGALILVDGLATSINDVDPNNIKSISVLKDAASAAMYGSRAANGVILIETKRGEAGKMKISYNSYAGWQNATQLPDFVESAEYAKLRNEANLNAGAGISYTDAEIEKFRNGSDPDNYPNVPHLKNLLTSGDGFQSNHNLSFMGGNDKTRYLFSIGYLQQNGIVAKNGYSKYNILLNTDTKIKDNLTLKVNLAGYTAENHSPRQYDGGMNSMINFAVRQGPIFAGKKSDGTYGYQDNYSPEAWMASESFYKGTNKYFLGSSEIAWEVIKGLTLSGKVGYNFWSYYNKDYASEFVFNANKTVGPNNLSVSSGQGQQLTMQSLATYSKQFDKHSFTILGGVSQEQYDDWGMSAYRKDFPTNTLYEINGGSATGMSNSGSASAWSMRSFFSRVNYSFNNRYLFEANMRSDATSRFPAKGRWGYFPSFSAGWILSEEDFLKNVSLINSLKVRASWGKLGNQNVGTYPYQNIVSLGQNYSLGGVLVSGAATTRLSNADVTWETTTTTDIGVDASLWKGKLDFTLGVFKKQTSGVLYSIASSATLGLSTSPVNIGGVENTGFEASLNYHANIGKVKIGLSPNFTVVNNKVTELANGLQQNIGANLFVGQSLGVTYGYVADGLFKDADDVAKYPQQPYSAQPGFIRYKDISGPNGVPDGKVDATYDRTFIGNTVPKYNFGLTLTANYKGFDFLMLVQGLAGWQKQMNNYQAFAFFNGGQIQRWQVENRWTTENPNPNALYPKLTSLNEGSGIVQTSTFWNRDASFARLKSLQVGYTFNNELINKMKIDRLRVYFSGQNLLSINSYYQGWDPEMAQNGGFYPLTSVYTFGVNVSF